MRPDGKKSKHDLIKHRLSDSSADSNQDKEYGSIRPVVYKNIGTDHEKKWVTASLHKDRYQFDNASKRPYKDCPSYPQLEHSYKGYLKRYDFVFDKYSIIKYHLDTGELNSNFEPKTWKL